MLQNKHAHKKGFTLVEMVIAMSILVIFVSSASVFFSYIIDSFVSTQFIGKSYEKVQEFKTSYLYFKSNSPSVIFESGGISTNNVYGFKLLAFANSTDTTGFIVGAYDVINDRIVTGVDFNYSDYVLFTSNLDGSGVTSVESDMDAYLSSIGTGSLKIYNDIKLIKLGYESLNSSDVGRLDLTIVPEYYKNYLDQPIDKFLTNNQLLSSFNISVVK